MMSGKVRIRVAIVRLSRIAFFRFFFKLYYRSAWLIFPPVSRLFFPEITSLRVHRGYSTNEWEPGISDIDIIAEVRDLFPRETACFIGKWNKFYRILKLLFPILGETIVTSRREQELYHSWGDIRSISAQTSARPNSAVIEIKTALDLWTECLHSHTQLCKMAISRVAMPAPIARRELRKCVLDIIRHSAACRRYPPLQPIRSRRETEGAPNESGDFATAELADILKRGEDAGADDGEIKRSIRLACAHAANILERDAIHLFERLDGLTAPAPGVKRFAAAPEEDESALHLFELLKKRLGTFFASAIFDNIFSSVVVLKHIPGCADDLACCISVLDRAAAWHRSLQGPVFLLGPKSLTLMGIGAYNDDPLKMVFPEDLNLNADSFACLQSGSELPFSIHRRTFFRTGENARLAPGRLLAKALYLESLSHFLRTWRSLLDPGACGAVYAVSRAVALWLYFVKKMPRPCFPLQSLLETFRKEKKPADGFRIFETSLLQGLQPADVEIISALNAETLEAASTVAAESAAAGT